ncbi:DUF423 domain-containing protein [Mesonia oceanica]|uniref:Uncharacterized protein n=1 Tax=Mesonia oceanica TaxID=2687242 RepID=A0AC61YBC2_9FLAO|nr:DUF423 domain-containing protein [Mesonia oceanica]MAO35875.1 hypothetical protein [Zunongwangia sp.]MAQ39879.1 hypothetical protein [Mesonia sp.]MBJ98143.1 hypothetical protein [Flavobacteriaceae bacterium]VVV01689.1 hypothetical protein FVB9532_02983 [Mesonia oceanica]|tara:strand:+ start:839 stop:1240 length:402 start_codon:yes stop_codon:yes gene_type:complete
MVKEITLIAAAVFGILAIVLGAFGAHALKKKFTEDQLSSFETGVKYQMYHAILLLIIGLNFPLVNILEQWMVFFIIVGVILFSFSIYGLCISSSRGKKIKILGPITPLGGLSLIIGWILMLVVFLDYGFYLGT